MTTLVEYLRRAGIVIDEDGALAIAEMVLRFKLHELRINDPQAKADIGTLEDLLAWW